MTMTAVVTDLNIMSKKISMLKLSDEKVVNEIEVDWKLAPEGATELVKVCIGGQRWRNPEKLQYWEMNGSFEGYYNKNSPVDEAKVLATRPQQTKTVADAYEYLNSAADGKWFGSYNYLCYRENNHWFYSGDKNDDVICSREQFEAYAKEQGNKQEDEKWTHTHDGSECNLLVDKHDLWNRIPVQYKNGEYGLAYISDLKPIKPKLSKEQCEVLIKFSSEVDNLDVTAEVESYLKKYS